MVPEYISLLVDRAAVCSELSGEEVIKHVLMESRENRND